MKRMKRSLLAMSLAGVLTVVLPAYIVVQASVTTVYAHGHHGGDHHSSSDTTYYYCGGHSAHEHSGGVCPYSEDDYCDGHSAHTHVNGSCPYNNNCVNSSRTGQAQNILDDSNYEYERADNAFGKITKRALRKYQKG